MAKKQAIIGLRQWTNFHFSLFKTALEHFVTLHNVYVDTSTKPININPPRKKFQSLETIFFFSFVKTDPFFEFELKKDR